MADFVPHAVSVSEAMLRIEHMLLGGGGACVLEGPPGASKTSQLNAMIRRLQNDSAMFGGCMSNASNMQSVDFFGWPMPTKSPLSQNGVPIILQPVPQEGLRGAYPILCPPELVHPDTPEDWLPLSRDQHFDGTLTHTMLQPYAEGIFGLDDVGKVAEDSVFASIAQLAEEGRTGQWGIPTDGWARVFITNAVEDGSFDHAFPAHTRNRVMWLNVYCAFEDVAPYWRECGMHPYFVSFAAAESGLVLSSKVPLGHAQFSTARSWMNAWRDATIWCQRMAGVEDANADNPEAPYEPVGYPVVGLDETDPEKLKWSKSFMTCIAARCGDGVAVKFHDFLLNMDQRPTMEEIIKAPDRARVPEHSAVIHATAEMMFDHANLNHIDEMCAYMMRLPKPVAATWCGRMAEKHNVNLIRSKTFHMLVSHCGTSARIGMYLGNSND